jgi:hypothetical protein
MLSHRPPPCVGIRAAGLAVLAVFLCAIPALACGTSGHGERTAADDPVCGEIKKLSGVAREEVLAIARILAIRPSMALDFSGTTGEYCLNTGSQVMTHFAARPEQAPEDIIYFIDAEPLVARGLRLQDFPPLDPDPARRQPNAWYRYEGQGPEPHHGREMRDRTWLVLAVDVK